MRYNLALGLGLVLVGACAQPGVRRDERVVFFPTVGYQSSSRAEWVLPIHGWIYEQSVWTRNLDDLIDAVSNEAAIAPEQRKRIEQRLRPFVAKNQQGRHVPVMLGNAVVTLGPADQSGHFSDEVRVPADSIYVNRLMRASNQERSGVRKLLVRESRSATAGPFSVEYRAICRSSDDSREFAGRVYLLPATGLSVVSDVDDTIRIADANNTGKMLKNTFAEPLQVVAGMPDVYAKWQREQGAAFHYLSAEPAQLEPTLAEFLDGNGFPPGSISLRTVDMSSNVLRSVLNLFDAPPKFKNEELAWLMQTLPGRRYVLVGDSGQSDPEVYGSIARRFPQQVLMVFIRSLNCCTDRASPRYTSAFAGVPESKWMLFSDASELRRWAPPREDSGVREFRRPPLPRALWVWQPDADPASRYETSSTHQQLASSWP